MRLASRASRSFHNGLACLADRSSLKAMDEYQVLEALLSPTIKREKALPYVEQVRRLRRFQAPRRSPVAEKLSSVRQRVDPAQVDQRLHRLMTGPALTSRDIDAWLHINILDNCDPYNAPAALDAALADMIAVASANSLRACMQYLAKYWQQGYAGVRPMIRTARDQAVAVLDRALEVHPRTTYVMSYNQVVPQTGIPDFDRFERFVSSFYKYLDVQSSSEGQLDVLEDKLLQLLARSGPLELAEERFTSLANAHRSLSGPAVDAFLGALSRHIGAQRDAETGTSETFKERVKNDLAPVIEAISGHSVTASGMSFLLVWVNTMDEFWRIFSLIENNSKVLSTCQLDLIDALVRADAPSPTTSDASALPLMTHLFALLSRLDRDDVLSVPAIDRGLVLAAKYGNAAGVARALDMRATHSETALPIEILDELLESFPLPSFPGSTQAASELLASRLRPLVKPAQLPKYISALQRSGGLSQLDVEWQLFKGTGEETAASTDVLLAFIAAFQACEEPNRAFKVVDQVLGTPMQVPVVQTVVAHELIAPSDLYPYVMAYVRRHGWSESDMDTVFGKFPQARDVAEGRLDIEALWPRQLV